MFDYEVDELDVAGAADAFSLVSELGLRVPCQKLMLAAHWADLHPPEGLLPADAGAGTMIGERAQQLGGDGTPQVAEFAPAELAPIIHRSIGQARSLIADAIDLRHRFPRIWRKVRRGIVEESTVRLIARSCRELSQAQAGEVDRMLAAHLIGIGRTRLEHLLDAAILRVDAEHMAQLAQEARRSRYIHFGQANEHGQKSFWGRMDAPDAIRMDAMINRLADIISQADSPIPGVPDRGAQTREEWRAVAHNLMGNPVLAAKILIQHEQPDLFDVLTELQQPPLRHDPASGNVHPDHYPLNDPQPAPADSDLEPPDDEETLPPDCEDADCADPNRWKSRPGHGHQDRVGDDSSQNSPEQDHRFTPADDQVRDRHGSDGQNRDGAGTDAPDLDNTDAQDPALAGADDPDRDPDIHDDHDRDLGGPDDHDPSTGNLDPFQRQQYEEQAVRLILRHLDPRKLLPSAVLYAHHYPGDTDTPIARVEDLGPASLEQLGQWLSTCAVRIQPVIDLNSIPPADAYEIPDRIRTAIQLRNPASIFPGSNTVSRRMDQDHTRPFRRRPDGTPAEPGQTGVHNLGPENRPEHRFVTHGRISVRQPVPGTYTWRTHLGQVLITSAAGTFDLGNGEFARAVWHASAPRDTVTLIA
ncbi:DUF222 domain-containing protein [Microlunatus elymi]|uniref:DUF222 domain-containing protein n=1 Tax=Microlunatus elymi TaxID=2596828 RepID=A0A516Q0R4_9ACTN|nr:DUF222 domain-containing protein [Microlunatus elymi]QDP97026.1 DUF222 domain-containing protein [Microlunatus elymi]